MTPATSAEPRRISYIPLDEIAAAARNPKEHNLPGIQTSIARFGFVSPAVIDERTGRLVAGHGRIFALRAMRDTGQIPPAGIRISAAGIWLVPVLEGWASRSDLEAEAFLLADNEWTVRGGWDNGALGQVLQDLVTVDPDLLTITGFTSDDLAGILAAEHDDGGMSAEEIDDGDIGEPPQEPYTQPGDMWQLGPHRLLCGDATNPDHIEQVLHDVGEPGIIYTDPPYGISAVPKDSGVSRGGRFRGKKGSGKTTAAQAYMPVCGDDTTTTAADTFHLLHTDYPDARHVWWGANHYIASAGLPDASCWLVWDKENGASDFADCELAWTNHPGAVRMLQHRWNGMMRASERGRRVHPKPVALAEWAFGVVDADHSRRTVLDVFGGSGSTLLAAHISDRRAAVIETEPGYIDVICRRFQTLTGTKPINTATGEAIDFTTPPAT